MVSDIEIVISGTRQVRLTVTPTRVTLKIPPSYSANDIEVITAIAQPISMDLADTTRSMRGSWVGYDPVITMWDNSKTVGIRYSCQNGVVVKK